MRDRCSVHALQRSRLRRHEVADHVDDVVDGCRRSDGYVVSAVEAGRHDQVFARAEGSGIEDLDGGGLVRLGIGVELEGTLGELSRRSGEGDCGEDKGNQAARRKQCASFGIVDANIEGILNRHHKLNTIQSHAAICDSQGRNRQGGITREITNPVA